MKLSPKTIAFSLVFPATSLSLQVAAAEFNYDYVQLSVVQSDASFGTSAVEDTTLKGFNVSASYSLQPNIVVGASFASASAKTNVLLEAQNQQTVRDRADIEVTAPSVFALYHNAFNEKADYLVGARVVRIDTEWTASDGTEISNVSGESTNKSVFGGVRYQFNEKLELNLTVDYDLDADDGDDEISYELGAQYKLNSTIDIGLGFEPDDDGDSFVLSVRKYL